MFVGFAGDLIKRFSEHWVVLVRLVFMLSFGCWFRYSVRCVIITVLCYLGLCFDLLFRNSGSVVVFSFKTTVRVLGSIRLRLRFAARFLHSVSSLVYCAIHLCRTMFYEFCYLIASAHVSCIVAFFLFSSLTCVHTEWFDSLW